MSAGERSVALLTTRLLALAALNRRSFAILDEPLEQLDPANRRIVALLLARAPSPAVPQIIATTFEEQLARRLERQLGDVHLEFIAADS
jgi:DNA repair exonuclease SbcCD ATPase subunit